MRECTISGCGQKHYARGWCFKHYMRWFRTKDDPTETKVATSLEEAFERYTQVTPGGCIEWTGTILSSGYGQVSVRGAGVRAHRAAWERVYGTIPEGMFVNHKCWNRACVNVEHLNLATPSESKAYQEPRKPRSRTGFMNVRQEESTGKFFAAVKKEGKVYYGSHRDKAEDASQDAQRLKEELYGEFAPPRYVRGEGQVE